MEQPSGTFVVVLAIFALEFQRNGTVGTFPAFLTAAAPTSFG